MSASSRRTGLGARHFIRNDRGTSAIEFAMIFPILALLYLGGVEISQLITVDRKLTAATSAVGDLVSQTEQINSVEMNGIYEAANAILAPHDWAPASFVVSSVRVTPSGGEVLWSNAHNATARVTNSSITIPASIATAGTTVIVAESQYTFTSFIGWIIPAGITLSDTFYLRPRLVDQVSWVGG